MNVSKKIVQYIALLLFFSVSINVTAEQWLYIDPLRPQHLFSIETNPNAFGIDDVRFDANFCSADDEYICITSADFEFYVPRELSDSIKNWTVNGNVYNIAAQSRISLFGIKDYVYFIDRPQKDGEGAIRFLYSKTRGLIGMGGFSNGSSGIFLLDIKCGFGASAKCLKE